MFLIILPVAISSCESWTPQERRFLIGRLRPAVCDAACSSCERSMAFWFFVFFLNICWFGDCSLARTLRLKRVVVWTRRGLPLRCRRPSVTEPSVSSISLRSYRGGPPSATQVCKQTSSARASSLIQAAVQTVNSRLILQLRSVIVYLIFV